MPLMSEHLRNTRLAKVKPLVEGDVLDLGCGSALAKTRFGSQIRHYVGVDRDEGHVKDLAERFPDAKFYARDLDADSLDFGAKFDTVLMLALIEHVFNQKQLLGEVVKSLKTGGRIVITTPTVFGNDVVHRIGSAVGLFAKSAADDHIVIFNRKRLEILANEFGLRLAAYSKFELGCNQLAVMHL
jgi:SAM-dependent methyltransferase